MAPSVVTLLIAAVLLYAAGLHDLHRRRLTAALAVAALVPAMLALTLSPEVRMGDWRTLAAYGQAPGWHPVRFEAHLSYVVLTTLGYVLPSGPDSPVRLDALSRAAGLLFVVEALVLGWLERWSAAVVRYVALAVAAPASLMYFGFHELGYLSLTMLGYPLLIRGLRSGGQLVAVAAALFGIRAALHGFGVLSLVSAAVVAAVSEGGWGDRAARVARIFAYGTACYLVWVFVYAVVLNVPVVPGHAEGIPWRPWLTAAVSETRINVPIWSGTGLRDIAVSLAVAGGGLCLPAIMRLGRGSREAAAALAFAVPSLLFVIWFWPVQGVAVELDLVFAAFPAAYALMFVSAEEPRTAFVATGVLAAGHLMFWYVVYSPAFINRQLV